MSLAQDQPQHLQVPAEKGRGMERSTETRVGSCLQYSTVERVRSSNVARLARRPTNLTNIKYFL